MLPMKSVSATSTVRSTLGPTDAGVEYSRRFEGEGEAVLGLTDAGCNRRFEGEGE